MDSFEKIKNQKIQIMFETYNAYLNSIIQLDGNFSDML
jgi:hypothetical protein